MKSPSKQKTNKLCFKFLGVLEGSAEGPIGIIAFVIVGVIVILYGAR